MNCATIEKYGKLQQINLQIYKKKKNNKIQIIVIFIN